MQRTPWSLVLSTAALVACRRDVPAPVTEPTAQPVAPITAPDAWHPVGPGCAQFIACCDAASASRRDVAVTCRLSTSRPPLDCAAALGTVRNYLTQRGVDVPAACNEGGSAANPTPAAPQAPPSVDAPMRCADDSECPRLACGPCQSGAPVPMIARFRSCTVNPCPGTVSVCRGGVCVVR